MARKLYSPYSCQFLWRGTWAESALTPFGLQVQVVAHLKCDPKVALKHILWTQCVCWNRATEMFHGPFELFTPVKAVWINSVLTSRQQLCYRTCPGSNITVNHSTLSARGLCSDKQLSSPPLAGNWPRHLHSSLSRQLRSVGLWSSRSPGWRKTATGGSSLLWFKRYARMGEGNALAGIHAETGDDSEIMACSCLSTSMETRRTHSSSTSAPTKASFCPATKSLCSKTHCYTNCECIKRKLR